jgi:hypothetical protein
VKHLIWIFLLFVFIISFCLSIHGNNYVYLWFSFFVLVLFLAVVLALTQNYKVHTKYLSIEPRLDNLERNDKELRELANTLAKAVLHTLHESSRYGGRTIKGEEYIINKYLKTNKNIPESVYEEVKKDIEELNLILKNGT